MKAALLILIAVCFSSTAFAQSPPPKIGNKPLAQAKPTEPMGCKLVGAVRGTKLWAGVRRFGAKGRRFPGNAIVARTSDRSHSTG